MIQLYYARASLLARPVWLALLEKELPFELIPVNLPQGAQFEPEFVALSPFCHIPVLVDGGFRMIESVAILDYLEAKYPEPALLPHNPETLATVRMVQMTAINELLPGMGSLLVQHKDPEQVEYARVRIATTLNFMEDLLRHSPYFAGEQITLAEIVAGTMVPALPKIGISLEPYPKLQAWSNRLQARPAWQQIQLTPEEFDNFKRRIGVMVKVWQKRRRQRLQVLGSQSTGQNGVD
ncbi:MAG: glutathione S-transferase family protein [Microcoleaceae cyanobacterium]